MGNFIEETIETSLQKRGTMCPFSVEIIVLVMNSFNQTNWIAAQRVCAQESGPQVHRQKGPLSKRVRMR